MMNHAIFSGNLKMADLLMINGRLLYVLPSFGMELGYGEKTISQVCSEQGIYMPFFLLVCNHYTFDDYAPNNAELRQIPIEEVVRFLRRSHSDYLEKRLPKMTAIVSELVELDVMIQPDTKNMLLSFCEAYRQEVTEHIQYEEEAILSYIDRRLGGAKAVSKISEYENDHRSIDTALKDLRNIIIKYAPCPIQHCMPLLIDLFMLEFDLFKHSQLENRVLIPLMERLDDTGYSGYDSVELSERERQTLAALARGMSNKEIADKLNISTHTVISHRKNIIRKTGIKTAQGLTLYAYLNDLITLKDLR